jgi:hypothetical protein
VSTSICATYWTIELNAVMKNQVASCLAFWSPRPAVGVTDYSDPSDLLVKVVPLQAGVAIDCDRNVRSGHLVTAEPQAMVRTVADSDFVAKPVVPPRFSFLWETRVAAGFVDSSDFCCSLDFHCLDLFFD